MTEPMPAHSIQCSLSFLCRLIGILVRAVTAAAPALLLVPPPTGLGHVGRRPRGEAARDDVEALDRDVAARPRHRRFRQIGCEKSWTVYGRVGRQQTAQRVNVTTFLHGLVWAVSRLTYVLRTYQC